MFTYYVNPLNVVHSALLALQTSLPILLALLALLAVLTSRPSSRAAHQQGGFRVCCFLLAVPTLLLLYSLYLL
jgi:hypothetical protein